MRRGAMLVDAIVAAVILGFAATALIGLAGRAINAQREGEDLATAAMLLDEKLNLVLMNGVEGLGTSGAVDGVCEAPFQRFRYRVEVSGDGTGGEPFTVRATVYWDVGGRVKSAAVETRVAPRQGDDPDPDRRPAETVVRDTV